MLQTYKENFWIKYKENIIIKFIPDDLKCDVCTQPMIEPYLLSCSDHYCSQCKDELFSNENKICKICNEEVDKEILDKKILKKLKEIQFHCLNSYECMWKGDITTFENHCNECLFQEIKCDLNCGKIIQRNNLSNHKINECEQREIICEFCHKLTKSKNYTKHLDDECDDIPIECPNQCKTTTKLNRKELEKHYKICPYQYISCSICKQIEIRHQMENHLKENVYSHILVLYNEISLLKKDKDIQNSQIAENKQQIAQNQQEILMLKEVIQNLTIQNDTKDNELQKLQLDQNEYVQENNTIKINSLTEKITLNHGTEVRGLLNFSKDLLISGGIRDIKYWNINQYNLILTIPDAHTSRICILKKLNEKEFISGGEDKSIKIWNVETTELIKLFTIEHTDMIWDLLILSDKRIASASFDNMIKIWDVKSNNSINTLNGHSQAVRSLIEMKKGNIISCSEDKTIRLWDLNKNKNTKIITKSHPILSLVKVNKSQFACGVFKEIIIFDYPNGDCVRTLKGHNDYIYDLILINCNIIASAGGKYDKSVKVWNSLTGEKLNDLNAHTDCVWRLGKLNENDIESCSSDGTVIIWKNFRKLKIN